MRTDPGARARVAAALCAHPVLAAALAGLTLADVDELAAAVLRAADPPDPSDAALRAELAAGHPRWGTRRDAHPHTGHTEGSRVA